MYKITHDPPPMKPFPCLCGPCGLDTHLKKDHTQSHAHAYSYKIIPNRDMLNLFKHTPLVQGFKQVQRDCSRYGDAVNPQALSNLILLSLSLSHGSHSCSPSPYHPAKLSYLLSNILEWIKIAITLKQPKRSISLTKDILNISVSTTSFPSMSSYHFWWNWWQRNWCCISVYQFS